MANDRLWIVCKNCKEKRLLIKYYPSFSYVWNDKTIGDWLLDHLECSNNCHEISLYGDNCFEAFAKSAEDD